MKQNSWRIDSIETIRSSATPADLLVLSCQPPLLQRREESRSLGKIALAKREGRKVPGLRFEQALDVHVLSAEVFDAELAVTKALPRHSSRT